MTSDIQTQLNTKAANATYGGTANAITLTASGVALSTGLQLSFIPTAANTTATTINLNGLGAVAVQPLARSGVALPSGYIRANVPVTAIYNGTVWLTERQTEYGTNANGDFTRFADGTLICRHDPSTIGGLSVAIGAQYVSSTYAFPAAFSGTSHSLHYSGYPTTGAGSRLNQVGLQREAGSGSWAFNFQNNSASTVTAINNPNLTAIGKWF